MDNDFTRNADDDRELLRSYAESAGNAEEAFSALAERYSGLVYGTSMRALGNAEWAADATQNVFAALAAKAPSLVVSGIPSVGAWLHRAATFESKRVMRDRSRTIQRQTMIARELNASSLHATSNDVWEELRPELDEAMQRLTERDRDILILHYFDGIGFREIASRLGIGAEAAQKRSRRAMEKLSRSLRARSTTASVTLLASGLGTELSQAAPTALIAKISSGTTTTSTSALIAAMTTTNKTAFTAFTAIAILACSIGGGYLIGETARPRDSLALQIIDPQDAPQQPGSTISSESVTPAPAREGTSRAQRFISKLETMIVERAALMAQVKDQPMSEFSTTELDSIFAEMEGIMNRAFLAVDDLQRDDLDTVFTFLRESDSRDLKHLGTHAIYSSWGKRNPAEALEIAAEDPSPANEAQVLYGWAMADAAGALGKQQEIAARDRKLGREAMTSLYKGWLSTDPGAAITHFETLEFDQQKQLFNVFGHLTRQPSSRKALFNSIAEVADEKLRCELIREVGGEWAEIRPDQVFEWFDTIEFENPRLANAAVQTIFNSATKRGGDIASAAEWVWPHLPEDQRAPFIQRAIRGTWQRSDPQAAAAWMTKHGITTSQESDTPQR